MVAITSTFFLGKNLAALFSADFDCSAFEQAENQIPRGAAGGRDWNGCAKIIEAFPLESPGVNAWPELSRGWFYLRWKAETPILQPVWRARRTRSRLISETKTKKAGGKAASDWGFGFTAQNQNQPRESSGHTLTFWELQWEHLMISAQQAEFRSRPQRRCRGIRFRPVRRLNNQSFRKKCRKIFPEKKCWYRDHVNC